MIPMLQSDPQLDQVFFALSDSTRRAILARLAEGDTTIGELAAPFDISKPAVTKHMKVLERAGLIDRRINGRKHQCSLSTSGLKTAEDWINFHRRFWESRFSALDNLLRRQVSDTTEN
jgi:DNA-binding transcriptional ArsR family regulator